MSFRTMTPPEAKQLLESNEGWGYLDVRTVEEFELGHAEGAWNIPFAVPDPATMQMGPNPEFAEVGFHPNGVYARRVSEEPVD